jgi:hypothetical protein
MSEVSSLMRQEPADDEDHLIRGHRFDLTPDPSRPGDLISRCRDCGHVVSIPDVPKLRVYFDRRPRWWRR